MQRISIHTTACCHGSSAAWRRGQGPFWQGLAQDCSDDAAREHVKNGLLRFLQLNCIARDGTGRDERHSGEAASLANKGFVETGRDGRGRVQPNFNTGALNRSAIPSAFLRRAGDVTPPSNGSTHHLADGRPAFSARFIAASTCSARRPPAFPRAGPTGRYARQTSYGGSSLPS